MTTLSVRASSLYYNAIIQITDYLRIREIVAVTKLNKHWFDNIKQHIAKYTQRERIINLDKQKKEYNLEKSIMVELVTGLLTRHFQERPLQENDFNMIFKFTRLTYLQCEIGDNYILPYIPTLRKLDIILVKGNMDITLNSINNYKNILKHLVIDSNHPIRNINFLDGMQKLEILNIKFSLGNLIGNDHHNILNGLISLDSLMLGRCSIFDTNLEKNRIFASRIKTLQLITPYLYESQNQLCDFTNIETLILMDVYNVGTSSTYEKLVKLKNLTIEYYNLESDFMVIFNILISNDFQISLTSFTLLAPKHMTLSKDKCETMTRFLEKHKSLSHLSLSNMHIVDIAFVRLKKLRKINLTSHLISEKLMETIKLNKIEIEIIQ